MSFLHHDEARAATVAALLKWLTGFAEAKAALIDDLFGKYRVIVWPSSGREPDEGAATLKRALAEAGGSYWSDQIWVATAQTPRLDQQVYQEAWEEGRPHPDEPRLRIVDRVRNRVAWFREMADPPWAVRPQTAEKGPPIVVFYSFKGGVGRTTALASFALRRARAGQRVVVIDGDLDAPGIGPLLTLQGPGFGDERQPSQESMVLKEEAGGTLVQELDAAATLTRWGVVDYLLEAPSSKDAQLSDYYQSVRNEPFVPGNGDIVVFPAGRVDENYLAKLARLDFDPARAAATHPWVQLLERIRNELRPDWVLLDSRAGLGEPAGLLLGGMAHVHVLLATASEQGWQGIRLILDRLGSSRVQRGKPQAECVMVQAMVPVFHDVAQDAQAVFSARAESEFEAHYYAEDPQDPDDDSMWFIRDMPGKDAPHRPVCLSYKERLAHFRRLEHVIPELLSEEYAKLAQRIESRFVEEPE